METILPTYLLPKQVIILLWYQSYLHNSIHASSFLPCPDLPSSESLWAGRTITNMQTTWSLALGHRVIPCVVFNLHRLESLGMYVGCPWLTWTHPAQGRVDEAMMSSCFSYPWSKASTPQPSTSITQVNDPDNAGITSPCYLVHPRLLLKSKPYTSKHIIQNHTFLSNLLSDFR